MRGLILAALLAASPVAAQQMPQQNAESIWRKLDGGAVEHLQSGLECPAAIGGLRLYANSNYDGFGLDVSCGWNGPGMAVTAYLSRGLPLDEAFRGAKLALEKGGALPGARLVGEGPAELGGLTWKRAQYAAGDRRSDIWITDRHGWTLKYRATYPQAQADAAQQALEAVTAEVQRTAEPRLAACAKSPPPQRTGRPQRGRKASDAGLMGAMLGGALAAGAAKSDAPATPLVYCPEERLAVGEIPALAWRGVTAEGADAGVDRLTLMSLGPPPVLQSARDELGALLANGGKGGPTVERWVATMQDGSRTLIYGYYEGRPPARTLAALVERIASGKAEPLSSYSVDGGDVSIGLPTRK